MYFVAQSLAYLTKYTQLPAVYIPQRYGTITGGRKQEHSLEPFQNLYACYGVEMRLKLLV